jgi:hypothetical protein
MSLLTLVQDACRRVSLARPNAVMSATDEQTQQLLGLANEEGQELAARYPWQALTNQAQFFTVGTEVQGTIQALTGPGFNWILNETIWNRTQRRPIFGPQSPAKWQELKASFMNGPWIQYRIRGNQLLFLPTPAVGEDCYFEWQSKYWVQSAGGDSFQYVNDADTSYLDERLITLGVIWRWKAAKGLEYAEDFAKYERAIGDAMNRDATKPRLNLDGGGTDLFPAGNWMV